jgi:NTE family protein
MTAGEAFDGVSLFSGLEPAVLQSLAERLQLVRLQRGEALFREGDPGAALFLIETGEVRVISQAGKREVCRLGPREHVGEMSLIDPAPRSATVVAGCDTTLWRLSAHDFDALCQAHPQVHRQLAVTLARRLRETTLGVVRRRAEAVVLLIDVRDSVHGKKSIGVLVDALAATTHRSVAAIHAGTARNDSATAAASICIESADTLGTWLDQLRHQHEHVLLDADATIDERLLRAALGRSDLAIVLFSSEAESVTRARRILDRLADISFADATPVELALDRRDEWPRVPFGPIDRLADGRALHTVAYTPGYSRTGAPDFDGFGRLARRIARRRVGLAMGGGGARAFAHIGVLAALERALVPIDVLAGTSGGAIIAGLAARDWDSSRIAEFLLARWSRRGVVDWGLIPWVSVLQGRKLEAIGRDASEGLTLEELTRPMVAVATDLVTGEAVQLRRGDGWTAVRASLSVPGVFPPVQVGDRYLVDGGAINNMPADAARDCGADIVIGVNVSPPLEPAFLPAAVDQTSRGIFERLKVWRIRGGLPLFRIIYRTITVQGQALQSRQGSPDVTVSPDVSGYDMFEFRKLQPIIERGRAEAEIRMEEIRRVVLD